MKDETSGADAPLPDPESSLSPNLHPQAPESAKPALKPAPSGVPRVDLALNPGELVKVVSGSGMDRRLFRVHKRTKKGFELRPVALLGWKAEK